jgi:hypothetical protein
MMKVLILTVAAALVLLFGVLAVVGFTFTRADALWIALPLIVGLADVVLVPAVGSTVRPLPYGASGSDARRISVGALSTVTFLRFVLAEAAALLLFAYPSTRVVDAIRERLESGGMSARFDADPSRQPWHD